MRSVVTGSAVLCCLLAACGEDKRASKLSAKPTAKPFAKPFAKPTAKPAAKPAAKSDGDGLLIRHGSTQFSSTSLEPSTGTGVGTSRQGGRSRGRGRIFGVAVAVDGRTYAVGDQAGTVELRRGDKILSTFKTGGREIWSLQFTADSKRLLVAADDTIGIWDLATHKPIWRLDEVGIYKQAHMTEDGGLVALVATGLGPSKKTQVVRLLSGTTGAVIRVIRVNAPRLEQVRLIRKGTQLLVAGVKGIYRYRIDPPLRLKTIGVAHPSGFDYHAAKDLLAVTNHDGVLRVVRAADGRVLHRFNLRQGGYGKYSPVFSPDGGFLATGGRSNTLWDVRTGMRLHRFGGRLTTGVRFLEGRARILVTGNDGSVRTPKLPSFAMSGPFPKVALPLSHVTLVQSDKAHEPGCYVASRGARRFGSPTRLFHVVQKGALVGGHHTVVAHAPLFHRAKGGLRLEKYEVTHYHRRGNHFFIRVSIRFDRNRPAQARSKMYLSAVLPKSLTKGTYRVLVSYDEIVGGVTTAPAAESVTTSFEVK